MRNTPFCEPDLEQKLQSIGVSTSGYLKTAEIAFSSEVRKICEENHCRNYAKTWACPPGAGSLEDCRQQILSYPWALVFASVYDLQDSYDTEGMQQGHRAFKEVCDRLYDLLEQPVLLLSNEGCIRCRTCTYPQAPCRFPEKLFPSLEGYGILVNRLARLAGIPYNFGINKAAFFGMVCFR